jgi:hypothetical protein
LVDVSLNGFHEVEAKSVNLGNLGDAVLADGTGADIGSSSRNSNAEGPAGLGNFFSALFGTLLELGLTSRSFLALLVLVGAFLLNAGSEFRGLSKGQGQKKEDGNNHFHSFNKLL